MLSFILSFVLFSFADPELDQYRLCDKDSHCVKVRGICGSKTSINKNYFEPFQKEIKKSEMKIKCEPFSEKKKKYYKEATPFCIKGICGLSRKKI